MNHIDKLRIAVSRQAMGLVLLSNCVVVLIFSLIYKIGGLDLTLSLVISAFMALILTLLIINQAIKAALEPLNATWQAIWHISPSTHDIPPPDINKLKNGREVAGALVKEIYDLASHNGRLNQSAETAAKQGEDMLLQLLPLPLIALDKDNRIKYLNQKAAEYFGLSAYSAIGQSYQDILRLSFSKNQETFESWLATSKSSRVTANSTWERVKISLPDNKGSRQFDLIASYNKDSPSGHEVIMAVFDRSARYSEEDNSTSYVAIAVHELRTPLTLLRGYIEVLDEELSQQLTPELRDFMSKMSASAQNLTALVSNILNVARIDENQLTLSLQEANWPELLSTICKDLELRAKVRGKSIELSIDPDLPTVAVDKVSIYEVLSNLVDNAVKYSGNDTKIRIHTGMSSDGNVETVVQDHGLGIPESGMANLFTKFYRSHRSKGTISGSGLGLYLVKSIVSAHGGNVWVQSKEGVGSSFGFTLQPYKNSANITPKGQGNTIDRQAHGWIKNHSMHRS